MTPDERFKANEKLVYFVYHKYFEHKIPESYSPDIIQEGMLGLWQACTQFDESAGVAFSTYAVPTIFGRMNHFRRSRMNTIRIPRSAWEKGVAADYTTVSLDELIVEDKTGLYDMLPGIPDDYRTLTIDLIEQFIEWERDKLAQPLKGPKKNVDQWLQIMTVYLYDISNKDAVGQKYLERKFGLSQPQVSRVLRRCKDDFKEFLNS